MKKIVSAIAMACLSAICSSALNLLPQLGSTIWNADYSKKFHTISYKEAWAGCGWWCDGADFSSFDNLNIVILPSTLAVTLVAEYTDDAVPATKASFNPGETNLALALDPKGATSVKSIYLQCGELTPTPTVTVESATLDPKPINEPITVFDGDFDLGNWDKQLEVNAAKFGAAREGVKLAISYHLNPGCTWGSFNLNWVTKKWKWIPMTSISSAPGYQASDKSVTVTANGEVTLTIDKADAAAIDKGGQMLIIKGANITISKIQLTK